MPWETAFIGLPTAAGATWTDLGTVTTADINGGTIDAATIGGTTPAAGTFSDLTAQNDAIVQGGDVTIGDGTTAYAGRIVLHDADGGDAFTTTIVSNVDVAASFSLTLPADDGSANQVLKTDGSGALSWTTPSAPVLVDNTTNAYDLQESTNDYINVNTTNTSEQITFGNATTNPQFVFSGTGDVGIGTASPAYDLDVNGDIRAIGSVYYGGTEGNADGTAYTKPDYVFEEGYDVMRTKEVEEYLKKEGHLPWMTSVRQERQENADAVNMTRMAFETVETAENLQMQVIALNIALNKVTKEQEQVIEALQNTISALQQQLAELEQKVK